MEYDQNQSIAASIDRHGNQLGVNLVHLKKFLDSLQKQQHDFLSNVQEASQKAQQESHQTARWAMFAAIAAAVAAIVQALTSIWLVLR
jgi:ABC-type transporter Mla subunit MlaD